jgi:hypothetical protein
MEHQFALCAASRSTGRHERAPKFTVSIDERNTRVRGSLPLMLAAVADATATPAPGRHLGFTNVTLGGPFASARTHWTSQVRERLPRDSRIQIGERFKRADRHGKMVNCRLVAGATRRADAHCVLLEHPRSVCQDALTSKGFMISNERPSPYGRRPYQGIYHPQPRPFIQEDTIKTAEFQVERKFITVTLKENPRGRFLRITEEGGSKRNAVIIPITGLDDFKRVINEMAQAAEAMPAPKPVAEDEHPDDSIGNR